MPNYRAAWANFYGRRFGVELDPDTELMGLLGSKEGIFKLPMAYVNPGDAVLVPDPGYITYSAGARFAGGEVVHMPLTAEHRFLPDLRALPADVLRRTKLMWLNYPNNPTGAVAPLEFFAAAVQLALEYGFLLAHDAPYTEITYDGYKAPSLLQAPRARETAVEFHSLSKTANMGGWRVGVLVRQCRRHQDHVDAAGQRRLGLVPANLGRGRLSPKSRRRVAGEAQRVLSRTARPGGGGFTRRRAADTKRRPPQSTFGPACQTVRMTWNTRRHWSQRPVSA